MCICTYFYKLKMLLIQIYLILMSLVVYLKYIEEGMRKTYLRISQEFVNDVFIEVL